MADVRLSIPYSIPVLGEAFTAVKNPVMLAALDLYLNVHIANDPLKALELPIINRSLRQALARLLEEKGLRGSFTILSSNLEGFEGDFLKVAALLYLVGAEELEPDLPLLMDCLDSEAFIILARALTSLSGGFVVCRQGEGLVSIEGGIDSAVHLKMHSRQLGRRRKQGEQLNLFTESLPELAGSLWHLLGHLVLEGGRAVRQRDSLHLGRLLTLESSLAHAVGLVGLEELRSILRPAHSLGGKVICSGSLRGELILTPKETLPLPSYSRFMFAPEGVCESGQG